MSVLVEIFFMQHWNLEWITCRCAEDSFCRVPSIGNCINVQQGKNCKAMETGPSVELVALLKTLRDLILCGTIKYFCVCLDEYKYINNREPQITRQNSPLDHYLIQQLTKIYHVYWVCCVVFSIRCIQMSSTAPLLSFDCHSYGLDCWDSISLHSTIQLASPFQQFPIYTHIWKNTPHLPNSFAFRPRFSAVMPQLATCWNIHLPPSSMPLMIYSFFAIGLFTQAR